MTYKIVEEDFEKWTLCFRNNLCSVTTILNISTSLVSIRVVRTIDLWRHKEHKYFFLSLFTFIEKFIGLICFTFFYYSYNFTQENIDVDNNNRPLIVVAKSLYYILETPIFRNERGTFRERPFNLKAEVMVFFLKKYSHSQCCWKKYSDFGGGKK